MRTRWLVVAGCVLSVLVALWFLRSSFVRPGSVEQPTEVEASTAFNSRAVVLATGATAQERVAAQAEITHEPEVADAIEPEVGAGLTLHVLDARTGSALDDLEVRVLYGTRFSLSADPMRELPLLEGATRSPVHVLAESGDSFAQATVAVRAPGFAWAEVVVDLGQAVERTILLEPGGDVRFVVLNGPAPEHASLEAVREGAPVDTNGYGPAIGRVAVCHTGLSDGVVISGVKAGVAYADVRLARRSVLEAGAVQFSVKPGVVTLVELPLRLEEKVDPLTVEGILRISAEWGLDPCELYVRREGSAWGDARAAVLEQLAVDQWRWSIQLPRAGDYCWATPGVPFGGTFSAERHSLVDLDVGDPAHLSLELIDPRTEEPAEVDSLGWWPVDTFFLDYGAFRERGQKRDPITGRFELRVPVGQGHPRPNTFELSVPPEATTIVAGNQRLDVRLLEPTSFGVKIQSGGRTVLVKDFWQPAIEQLDGAGTYGGGSHGGSERTIKVSWPGVYRITWPQLDGFAPIEPSELILKEGVNETVVLDLIPLR